MSKETQNEKSVQNQNTPQNVITNAARFNKQFLDSELGHNATTVSIGKMLTVMGEQDNTIRALSRILGRDYNEQHLHDMHNTLFGDIASGSSSGREGMHLGNLLTQLTTFIHQQINRFRHLLMKLENMLNNSMIKCNPNYHHITN